MQGQISNGFVHREQILNDASGNNRPRLNCMLCGQNMGTMLKQMVLNILKLLFQTSSVDRYLFNGRRFEGWSYLRQTKPWSSKR